MRKVLVRVARERDWRIQRQAVRANRFYLLKDRDDFEVGEKLCLLLSGPGKLTLAFDAKVLYVNPERGVGLEVIDGEGSELCGAPAEPTPKTLVETGPADGPTDPAPDPAAPSDEAAEPESEKETSARPETTNEASEDQPRPPEKTPRPEINPTLESIKKLGATARRRLALVGNRLERSILFQDRLRDVQSFVLLNPKLGLDDVIEYSLFPHLTSGAIAMFLENTDWMTDPHVRFHLAKNPSVPRRISHDLLEHLEPAQIRHIAKDPDAREEVRDAAQEMVDKMSKAWT
jgi:hypothetical protein